MSNRLLIIAAVAIVCSCGNSGTDFDASGVFETTEITVSAKGTGEIVSLTIDEGQDVKAGQELGTIDMTQLRLKRAQLEATRKATDSRRLDEGRQVAIIKQQIINQQKDLERFRSLLADGAATQKQVDDIEFQIGVLQKQLAATTEQVATQNVSIDGQSSGIAAEIAQIEDMMSNSVIRSPADGIILDKYAERGEYATPGKALFKMGDIANMRLRAYVTADQLTSIKLGQKVKVYADQGKDGRKEYDGVVTWISDKAEFTPKTIQTRDERANLVYAVKISVKNDGLIKRGMYGDVKF